MTNEEIVDILKKVVIDIEKFKFLGICYRLKRYCISDAQYAEMLRILYDAKPGTSSKFYWHKSYINEAYWWTRDDAGYKQRIKFLNHLIKKYESPNIKTTMGETFWERARIIMARISRIKNNTK